MNRLTSKLQNLKENNKKALVAYLVAGDPDLDTTLDLMHLFVDSGVDVIEIGVPFTDPIAEGPTIQKAHDRALKNNISLKMILELVDKFRETNKETPIVLMGYLNTFISHIDLVQSIGENSADSILVVDVPGELNLQNYGITNPNINTISLRSPTTKDDRVESIAKNSTGFIYYVTLRGVTGSSNLNIEEIKKGIKNLKLNKLPEIFCEPGRAIVAESGSSIVKVILRKKQNLYINDGTYGSLFDAGAPNFIFPSKMITNGRVQSKKFTSFSFFGPTCDSLDYMKGPFLLPNNIKEGDYIELGQLGAYGLTFRTNFNGFFSNQIFEVNDKPIMSLYEESNEKVDSLVA